jgi:hypothetical protein
VAQRGGERSDCVHDAVAGVIVETTRLCMMRAISKTNKRTSSKGVIFHNMSLYRSITERTVRYPPITTAAAEDARDSLRGRSGTFDA